MGSRTTTTTEPNRRKLCGNRSDFRNEIGMFADCFGPPMVESMLSRSCAT
jgi:hypothetical protein